jgi:hypothetical protein
MRVGRLAPAVLAAAWVVGCAKGAPPGRAVEQDVMGVMGPAGRPAVEPSAPEGAPDASRAEPDAGPPATPAGEPCMRDEVEACTCIGLSTEGERHCRFDANSPLDGFFSECERCRAPGPEPTMPDAGEGGSDAGAAAGASGATNAGAGGIGGAGGAGGTAPPTGMGCAANPAMCMGALQCCRQDGACGLGLPGVLCL